MTTHGEGTKGFGTTADEWELLQLAYNIAVKVAQGETPGEAQVARFRSMDESSGLMFDSWWDTRPQF